MCSHHFPIPHLRTFQVRAIPFWATTSTASVATSSPRMPSTIRRWRRRWNCCDRMGPTCRRMGWLFWLCQDEHIQVGDESVLWGCFFLKIFYIFFPIIAYHCLSCSFPAYNKAADPGSGHVFERSLFVLLSLFLWLRALHSPGMII